MADDPRSDEPTEAEAERRRARCDELLALFERAPIRHSMKIEFSYEDDERAVFEMAHQDDYDHALGDTHGGIIATLLDNAGWFTAAVRYPGWISTVELSMRLLEPARGDRLRAVGRIVRAGRRLAVAQMEVHSDSGRLIAIASGTFAATSLTTSAK